MKPNQGIRRSVHNAIIVGLFFGGISALFGFLDPIFAARYSPSNIGPLPGGLTTTNIALLTERYGQVGMALRDGLATGITAALLAVLIFGGLAVLRHLLIRVLLARADLLPWQAVRFLDDAARRILLYKDGGGYRFIHSLLRDYFAELEPSLLQAQPSLSNSL
jgi:hypothetical protein